MRVKFECNKLLRLCAAAWFSGQDEEPLELLAESMGYEEEWPFLQCFKCDLGFWDACYTTETVCVPEERCFTGRGKAGTVCFNDFVR